MREVVVFRDIGALQSFIMENALPNNFEVLGKELVIVGGFLDTDVFYPLEAIRLNSKIVKRQSECSCGKKFTYERGGFCIVQ